MPGEVSIHGCLAYAAIKQSDGCGEGLSRCLNTVSFSCCGNPAAAINVVYSIIESYEKLKEFPLLGGELATDSFM